MRVFVWPVRVCLFVLVCAGVILCACWYLYFFICVWVCAGFGVCVRVPVKGFVKR